MLLDVRMPELDGWELLQQVQRQHGRAAPVIMSSGVVDKPFDPQQPLEQARRILSR